MSAAKSHADNVYSVYSARLENRKPMHPVHGSASDLCRGIRLWLRGCDSACRWKPLKYGFVHPSKRLACFTSGPGFERNQLHRTRFKRDIRRFYVRSFRESVSVFFSLFPSSCLSLGVFVPLDRKRRRGMFLVIDTAWWCTGLSYVKISRCATLATLTKDKITGASRAEEEKRGEEV